MSMRSYFAEGYGFTVENTTDKKILEFLETHINTIVLKFNKTKKEVKKLCKALKDIDLNEMCDEQEEEIQNFFEDIPLENTNINCELRNILLEIITMIIETETKIPVKFMMSQEDCIGDECMIIPLDMPWNFPTAFRNMNRKTVNTILMKYNKELNGKHAEDLDYHEIESYG